MLVCLSVCDTGVSLLSDLSSSLGASYPWISPYHPYHNGAAAAAAAAAMAAAQLVSLRRPSSLSTACYVSLAVRYSINTGNCQSAMLSLYLLVQYNSSRTSVTLALFVCLSCDFLSRTTIVPVTPVMVKVLC